MDAEVNTVVQRAYLWELTGERPCCGHVTAA
jgi:hypothetical protein